MRLDKFLSVTGTCSRTDAKRAVRAKGVSINGCVAKSSDVQIDEERDEITYLGRVIVYRKFNYIMLNKPEGVVSATEDGRERTVLDLLPSGVRNDRMFPCGRLDKNTLGLMLITDNGELAHKLLAPKSHVSKSYAFRTRFPLSEEDVAALERGVDIGGYVTQPCRLQTENPCEGVITITEGKYHQIKLMMEAVHNKITYLERISFGPLKLDPSLARGEWRELTDEELSALRDAKERKMDT